MEGQIFGIGGLPVTPGEKGGWTRCPQQTWLLKKGQGNHHYGSYENLGPAILGDHCLCCSWSSKGNPRLYKLMNVWVFSWQAGKLSNECKPSVFHDACGRIDSVKEIICNLGAIFTFKMLLIMFNTKAILNMNCHGINFLKNHLEGIGVHKQRNIEEKETYLWLKDK